MSKITETSIYPEDAILAGGGSLDIIDRQSAVTLDELFRERVRRSPNKIAYNQYDTQYEQWYGLTWAEIATQVERWQVALHDAGLTKGDRVAICHKNSIEWVVFDQAALRLGLVVVPIYIEDRPENISYVLQDSGARLVLFSTATQASEVLQCDDELEQLELILIMHRDAPTAGFEHRLTLLDGWLPEFGQHLQRGITEPDDLASIVYTSGTTGRPKGVMLSHRNILSNAYNGMRSIALKPEDRLLSFLPLSHTFERTIGYYAPLMCASIVTYNRSIKLLAEDIQLAKPTVMISVPRVFERVHNQLYATMAKGSRLQQWLFQLAIKSGWHRFECQQGRRRWSSIMLLQPILDRIVGQKVREKLGGHLDYVIVGGAALPVNVSKTFISLGIKLLQGYGLTESSPVLTVNTFTHHRADAIGLPLHEVQLKVDEHDELLAKGENIMMGYWQNQKASQKTMDGEWLKTGDRATIDEYGFLRIIGRIKEIIVLATGEKVPPGDIEMAILEDPLFEQVMVLGEAKSFLTALVVLNKQQVQQLKDTSEGNQVDFQALLIDKIKSCMQEFPGYANVRKCAVVEEWTVENGMLTPTLKLKRPKIQDKHADDIAKMYAGHGVT